MEIRVPPLKLNLLDRVVGYVSPARAMDRLRARAGLGFLFGLDGGGYDAGKSDKKALQRYNPLARSARGDVNPGLDKMRARSRDQVRNNPLAAGALNTTVTSTVGAGLTCQPHIDQDVLGLSDEQADAWARCKILSDPSVPAPRYRGGPVSQQARERVLAGEGVEEVAG